MKGHHYTTLKICNGKGHSNIQWVKHIIISFPYLNIEELFFYKQLIKKTTYLQDQRVEIDHILVDKYQIVSNDDK